MLQGSPAAEEAAGRVKKRRPWIDAIHALKSERKAVILAHNHPSGESMPSRADEVLTKTLANTLGLIDVKLLDHFIVGGAKRPFSFAERGLL